MNKIEVGEYVRTNRGIIAKVIHIRKATRFKTTNGTISHSPERYFLDNEQKYSVTSGYIKSHSKNIIDLIEVGDIVNGNKVVEIDNCKGAMRELYLEYQNPEKDCGIYFEQIETILTHELYEENSYEVVE